MRFLVCVQVRLSFWTYRILLHIPVSAVEDLVQGHVVMGHASVATTQGEYEDKDLHVASRDMQKYWDEKEAAE